MESRIHSQRTFALFASFFALFVASLGSINSRAEHFWPSGLGGEDVNFFTADYKRQGNQLLN
jgi:hypothetical protein